MRGSHLTDFVGHADDGVAIQCAGVEKPCGCPVAAAHVGLHGGETAGGAQPVEHQSPVCGVDVILCGPVFRHEGGDIVVAEHLRHAQVGFEERAVGETGAEYAGLRVVEEGAVTAFAFGKGAFGAPLLCHIDADEHDDLFATTRQACAMQVDAQA